MVLSHTSIDMCQSDILSHVLHTRAILNREILMKWQATVQWIELLKYIFHNIQIYWDAPEYLCHLQPDCFESKATYSPSHLTLVTRLKLLRPRALRSFLCGRFVEWWSVLQVLKGTFLVRAATGSLQAGLPLSPSTSIVVYLLLFPVPWSSRNVYVFLAVRDQNLNF